MHDCMTLNLWWFFSSCRVQLCWLQDHYISALHHSFKNAIRLAIKFGVGLIQFIYWWDWNLQLTTYNCITP